MIFLKQVLHQSRHLVLYAAVMAALVFALKWLQWKYLITDNSSDIYIALIALIFTALGVWLTKQMSNPKIQTLVVEKKVYVAQPDSSRVNDTELQKLNLTTREYEVLQCLTKGHSNAEIAERLFLSLSTVKTHVSNLLVKMEVKSRAQAIEKANRLKIIP